MGRASKKPIQLPAGVTFKEENGAVIFTGPKGDRRFPVLPFTTLQTEQGALTVNTNATHRQARVNQGTMHSLVRGALKGVVDGFSKSLEVSGIGFKPSLEGKTLVLLLGFVHPVRFDPPEGVSISVEKNTITVSGADKELVGRIAAEIRALKKPEPYKGKGIRYQGEVIRRKSGKKAAAAGTTGS